MYTTLLWATDGSPECDPSLDTALALLEPHGHLIAYHCDQRFLGGGPGSAPVLADELDRQRHLAAQIASLRACGIDARLRIESTVDSAPTEIAAAAIEAGADAIVCGTQALHGLRALVSGSVAARLVRKATVPVIVVPQADAASNGKGGGQMTSLRACTTSSSQRPTEPGARPRAPPGAPVPGHDLPRQRLGGRDRRRRCAGRGGGARFARGCPRSARSRP